MNPTTYPIGSLVRVSDICRGAAKDGQPGRPGLLPINRSTWYKWLKEGRVPPGQHLGPNTVAWPIEVVRAIGKPEAVATTTGSAS